MARRRIAMNPIAEDAARILGQQVRVARRSKKWTAAELAERAGVSQRTVLGIESGSASISVGNLFNVASIADVPLFGTTDPVELAKMRRRGEERLALLPTKVYHQTREDDGSAYDF